MVTGSNLVLLKPLFTMGFGQLSAGVDSRPVHLSGVLAIVHGCQSFGCVLLVLFSGLTDLDKRRQHEVILGLADLRDQLSLAAICMGVRKLTLDLVHERHLVQSAVEQKSLVDCEERAM